MVLIDEGAFFFFILLFGKVFKDIVDGEDLIDLLIVQVDDHLID